MSSNRITGSRPKDIIKTVITDLATGVNKNKTNRTFFLGQVINSSDPENANRIRVRIPTLDDLFFITDQGNLDTTAGNDLLPWCIPSQTRLIDTPENGSVVLIGLFNPEEPYHGRIWFNSLNELSATALFDPSRLTEEITNGAWDNAEKNINVNYGNTPGLRNHNALTSETKVTNFPVGLRGKSNNELLLEENKTSLVQNKNAANQSIIELTNDLMASAEELEILTTKSNMRHNPVFAKPLFAFMGKQMNLLQKIVTLLNSVPGISPFMGLPVAPSPAAPDIQASFAQLQLDFTQLKQPGQGSSEHLTIN
jgi:hypothetical protein